MLKEKYKVAVSQCTATRCAISAKPAHVATARLAAQVVRKELQDNPETILDRAYDAVDALQIAAARGLQFAEFARGRALKLPAAIAILENTDGKRGALTRDGLKIGALTISMDGNETAKALGYFLDTKLASDKMTENERRLCGEATDVLQAFAMNKAVFLRDIPRLAAFVKENMS